jgi:hypothetical protein
MPLSSFPTILIQFDQAVNAKQVLQNLLITADDSDTRQILDVTEGKYFAGRSSIPLAV